MVASDAGDFRIVKTDSAEGVREVLATFPSETLSLGASDPRLAPLVPLIENPLRSDDKIVVEYKTGTATQITAASCALRIPIRRLNTRTGIIYESFLRASDILADTTIAANNWIKIGEYKIPQQQVVKVGHKIPDNSKIYVSLVE